MCDVYPKCRHAAGSCCAVDWSMTEEERRAMTIMPDECFDFGDQRLFEEKEKPFNYRNG